MKVQRGWPTLTRDTSRAQVLGKCENVGVLDLNLAPATDVPDGYVFHECPILGDGAR